MNIWGKAMKQLRTATMVEETPKKLTMLAYDANLDLDVFTP